MTNLKVIMLSGKKTDEKRNMRYDFILYDFRKCKLICRDRSHISGFLGKTCWDGDQGA